MGYNKIQVRSKEWSAISDPATLPAGYSYGTAMIEYGGTLFLSVAHIVSPFITTYQWSGTAWVKMANPATLPTSTGYGTAMIEYDGTLFLSVAHTTSPFITTYQWSGTAWVKIANPATLPASTGYGTAMIEYDGTLFLSVAHATSPFITTYQWSSTAWVKMANPATLPASTGYGTAMLEYGGTLLLAVSHATTPFITTYQWSGTAWIKIANPATLPTSSGYGTAMIEYDGTLFLAVAHTASPYITTYQWSGTAWVKIANPATLPTNNSRAVAMTEYDGTLFLAVAHATSPFITIYQWSSTAWVKMANPATLPTSNGMGAAMLEYGGALFLSMANTASPFITTYQFGTKGIFVGSSIESSNLVLETNPVSAEIPINVFKCVLRSNEQLDEIILTGDKISVSHIGASDTYNFGDWYVTDVKQSASNRYTVQAQDAIGFVNNGSQHMGGIYTGETVGEIVAEILGNSVSYSISDSVVDIHVYGWLPVADRRDNLTSVLFAAGAVIRRDTSGKLFIDYPKTQPSGSFGANEVYLNASFEKGIPASQFSLTEYAYVASATVGSETIFEGTISGETTIKFDSPYHTLSITGGTIVESDANYAVITSSGNITLKGIPYLSYTQVLVSNNSDATKENAKSVTDCTLISSANSGATSEMMLGYLVRPNVINADVIMTGQMPGDIVRISHPYTGEETFGTIETMNINMTSKLKAAITIRAEYIGTRIKGYDTVAVIASSGTWTVPDGVDRIKAVVIRGGTGGASGGYGSAGDGGWGITSSSTTPYYIYYSSPGTGGSGGNGGSAGASGYVLESDDISVSPGNIFSAIIGAAGVGGTGSTSSTGAAGTVGGHSSLTSATLGISLSSAAGSIYGYGYLDPINGITYAVPATDGIAGGDGGDGGATVSGTSFIYLDGEQGDSVSTYSGGSGGTGKHESGSGPTREFWMGGGGGSGAVNGKIGVAGGVGSNYLSGSRYYVTGGTGAAGVTPAKPSTGTYGSGGHGGSGGSGAGGAGACNIRVSNSYNASISPASGGAASAGGSGGNGGQGCILIYYAGA